MSDIIDDFKSSIFSSEATNLAKDYAEIALDSVLEDGLFKDIPILGSILTLFKIGQSIKEKHLIEKIATFLSCLEDITKEEKDAFLRRLADEDKNEELFKKLLLIIDRIDETLKAEIIGNLFRMYIMDVFDKQIFLRCCSIVERAFVPDLIELYLKYNIKHDIDAKTVSRFKEFENRRSTDLTKRNLVNLGLLETNFEVKKGNVRLGDNEYILKTSFTINTVGNILKSFMFYDFRKEEFRRKMDYEKKENQRLRKIFKGD